MKISRKVFLTAAASLCFVASAQSQAMKEINFGIISTDSSTALKSMWQPFMDDMAKATGMKINGFFATDYTGIIEGMRFGKVHLAWHGNKSAIEAVDRAGGEVFAQFIDLDGRPGYYSYVITHRDSPLKTIDDMIANGKTLSFGLGDPQSTSGTLVPTYYVFSQRKLDPKNVFRVTRSANHGTNLLAVLNKQVDVATNNSENLDKLKERQPEKVKDIKIIWTSPLIPLDPMVMSKSLPEATKAKIKTFFYNYAKTDAREKEVVMKISKLSGFKVSTNDQLKPIRQLELFSQRNKVDSDTTMSDSEKKTKLADVDQKLAALK